jgi:hypothetical protein
MRFLIVTYSTIIADWKSIYGTSDESSMPHFSNIDRKYSIARLALSCVLFKEFVRPTNRYEYLTGLGTSRIIPRTSRLGPFT